MSQIVAMTIDDARSDFVWFGLFTFTTLWFCVLKYVSIDYAGPYIYIYICIHDMNICIYLHILHHCWMSRNLVIYQKYFRHTRAETLQVFFFFFFRVGPFQRVHSQHVQTSGCPLVGQNSFIVIQIIHWWEIQIIISSCHDVVRSSMMNDK